ncbi:alpha-N-acetylneuraminide alpha-2,8-sialyltransferase-like [Saccoglossus kowalevskii]|uniref:Alpha-N-acetylneuraminide alpha-2,8-sialyltransferase-like n=1 Tax=Saccoglossus kowalevskii TaxID=10224 RepID=A0ABM0LXX5_SACKO|nr:PREDICTED: alpha-N-acetylneuraminide alpha-2,8-sialyltransferase-like [Saccoglossus kowalevskii]
MNSGVRQALGGKCCFLGLCLFSVTALATLYFYGTVNHTISFKNWNSSQIRKLGKPSRTSAMTSSHEQTISDNIFEIRQKLKQHMNTSSFLLTQENTHVGKKYYNSYFQYSVTIKKSFLNILPKTSPFSNKNLFETCAVVGNGGILKNSNCGKEIDGHDFVIRTNLQEIRKFADDAGSKTNLTTITPSTRSLIDKHSRLDVLKTINVLADYNGYLMWIPHSWKQHHNSTMEMAFEVAKLLQTNTSLRLLFADPQYSKQFRTYWKIGRKIFSSGLTIVSIALDLCEDIHVYGFWPFPANVAGGAIPMHYSEDISWDSYKKTHDYATEFKLLNKFDDLGIIQLHLDDCDK